MKSLGKKATGARLERMQDSRLWAGDGFRNIHPILPGLRDLTGPRVTLSEFLCGGGERRVPRGPLPSSNPLGAWASPPDTGLRATWLGHSTVLIEIDGMRVLTDPVWGPRASPSTLAGPKRFQPVPVASSALPPIDLVLVSHDHYDHLDYPTIRELAPAGALRHLARRRRAPRSLGCRARAHHRAGLVAVAHGARHRWQGRADRLSHAFAALLRPRAERPQRDPVVVAGDPRREALALLQRRHRPDWDAPGETLLALAPAQGVQLVMPQLGDPVEPSRAEVVTPWWREVDARWRGKAALPAQAPEPMTLPKAMPWPVD